MKIITLIIMVMSISLVLGSDFIYSDITNNPIHTVCFTNNNDILICSNQTTINLAATTSAIPYYLKVRTSNIDVIQSPSLWNTYIYYTVPILFVVIVILAITIALIILFRGMLK